MDLRLRAPGTVKIVTHEVSCVYGCWHTWQPFTRRLIGLAKGETLSSCTGRAVAATRPSHVESVNISTARLKQGGSGKDCSQVDLSESLSSEHGWFLDLLSPLWLKLVPTKEPMAEKH